MVERRDPFVPQRVLETAGSLADQNGRFDLPFHFGRQRVQMTPLSRPPRISTIPRPGKVSIATSVESGLVAFESL